MKQDRLPPPRDKHNAPSRPGALLRLVCALLVLTLCAAPLLYRYSSRVSLPVVYAADGDDDDTNIEDITAHTGTIITQDDSCIVHQLNVYTGATLTISEGTVIEMQKVTGNVSHEEKSEIQVQGNATLHLKGKITGEFGKLAILTGKTAHFYVHLDKGAVFDATYDGMTELFYKKDIECYGYNLASNSLENVKVTDKNDKNTVENGEGTVGSFNQDNPGTIYTYTANGDKSVKWIKGLGGEELEADPDIKIISDRKVQVSCRGNAKFQVYAFFLPDPVWHWNENHTEATVTIYDYNKDAEDFLSSVTENATVTNNPDGTITATYDPYSQTIDGNGTVVTSTTTTSSTTTSSTTNNNDNNDNNTTSSTSNTGTGTGTNPTNPGGTDSNRYKFTLDSVFTWKRQTNGGMPVVVKDTVGDDSTTYDKLVAVYVDGARLTRNVHYTATRGSINITLHQDYLKTLSVGTHTLYVQLEDGYVQNTFTITASSSGSDPEKGDSPNTGEEDGSLIFYVWLVIVSFGGVGSLLVLKKKMKHAYR